MTVVSCKLSKGSVEKEVTDKRDCARFQFKTDFRRILHIVTGHYFHSDWMPSVDSIHNVFHFSCWLDPMRYAFKCVLLSYFWLGVFCPKCIFFLWEYQFVFYVHTCCIGNNNLNENVWFIKVFMSDIFRGWNMILFTCYAVKCLLETTWVAYFRTKCFVC